MHVLQNGNNAAQNPEVNTMKVKVDLEIIRNLIDPPVSDPRLTQIPAHV